jgi:hypothetical protein
MLPMPIAQSGRFGAEPQAAGSRLQQCRADQRLDRLCRICLCATEQAGLHQDGEQGRQDRFANQRSVPGRGRQCRLEFSAGLWRDSGEPARRRILADDGGDLRIPKQPPDAAAATAALKFFAWAYGNGGKMAEELDYVPMPAEVVKQIKDMWAKSITGSDGKPLYVTAN